MTIPLLFSYQGKAFGQVGTGNEIKMLIDDLKENTGDTIFKYDDGTCDDGWSINPGFIGWLGNLFPVASGTTGVLKSFDVYFLLKAGGSVQELSIDVFNSSYQLIGSSATFDAVAGSWISVSTSDIPFSGQFYVMVKWNNLAGNSHYLGLDIDGPYAFQDLERYYDGTIFQQLSDLAGATPGSFLVRPHATLGPLGIDDIIINDPISVFPNPAKNYIEISSVDELTDVKIVDITGKILINYPLVREKKMKIDLSEMNDGLYLLSITTKNGTSVKKISIFH
jgi:hypothetical protein